MSDPNNASSRNQNGEVVNPTSNGSEQDSMATGETNSSHVSRSTQRTTATQTDPETPVHGIDQRRNQRNGRRISMHDPGRFLLGLARPSDDIINLHQYEDGSDRIMHPMDEMGRVETNSMRSTSTNVNPLDIRESIAVEDPRPHDLPTPVIPNPIHREIATNNADNHLRVNERASSDRGTNTNAMPHCDNLESTTVRESTATAAPTEYLHDVEFSEDNAESNSDHQLVAESELNDRRAHTDSLAVNDSSATNEGETLINPGDVTVSNEMVNISNETSVTVDQTNSTAMPQLPCSEASVRGPNAQTSTGCVNQAVGCIARLLTAVMPGFFDSGEESSEDSVV